MCWKTHRQKEFWMQRVSETHNPMKILICFVRALCSMGEGANRQYFLQRKNNTLEVSVSPVPICKQGSFVFNVENPGDNVAFWNYNVDPQSSTAPNLRKYLLLSLLEGCEKKNSVCAMCLHVFMYTYCHVPPKDSYQWYITYTMVVP